MQDLMYGIAAVFEVVGVGCIVAGFAVAFIRATMQIRGSGGAAAFRTLRRTFGHSILLGLEILIAADLVRTVAIEPTLANLAVLGLLVVIRTFLSWALEVEIEGHWPWQHGPEEQ